MGSVANETQAGGRPPAAKPKRAQNVAPDPTPWLTPAQHDREGEPRAGSKGRWTFPPSEPTNAFSRTSAVSNDPTITSVGGPESEVMSHESDSIVESGHWILRPMGSVKAPHKASTNILAKRPEPGEPGEASARKLARNKRPSAPKPRPYRRTLAPPDSQPSMGGAAGPAPGARTGRSATAFHSATDLEMEREYERERDRERERERDALAISSAIDLAWKEAWDLPTVGSGLDARPPPPGKSTEAATARPADRRSGVKKPRSLSEGPGAKPGADGQPRGQEAVKRTSSPSPDKSSEQETYMLPSAFRKPKPDQMQIDEAVATLEVPVTKKDSRSDGPFILPRSKRALSMPRKELLASDVCPVGTCVEPPDRRPDKYCPWHPRSIINAWGAHKPMFPGWLSVEEEEKISRAIGREKRLPCSPPKPKVVDAATTCCVEDFLPKITKVRTTKVIAGRKSLRPEIRRWLLGYPQTTRYQREIQDLIRNAPEGLMALTDEENERHIFVDMQGPVKSLYEGGLFRIEVFFPEEYPREPPMVRFMTKIYHPNVDKLGRIRLPEMEEKWSPSLLLRELLGCLRKLLLTPNVDEPIAIDVARRWYWQETSAQQTARLWTRKFAHRHTAAAWLDCRCDCCCEQLAAVSVFI